MSLPRNFLDTNILLYAFADDRRAPAAQALLQEPFVVSAQALNEFVNVGRKKLHVPWERIREAVEIIVDLSAAIVSLDEKITLDALTLAERHNFSFYDATMVTAALQADCERFYSEDLHNGLIVDKRVTIINPFL